VVKISFLDHRRFINERRKYAKTVGIMTHPPNQETDNKIMIIKHPDLTESQLQKHL
jgi:hypothetical protein